MAILQTINPLFKRQNAEPRLGRQSNKQNGCYFAELFEILFLFVFEFKVHKNGENCQ